MDAHATMTSLQREIDTNVVQLKQLQDQQAAEVAAQPKPAPSPELVSATSAYVALSAQVQALTQAMRMLTQKMGPE